MAQTGKKGVRAAFVDPAKALARERPADPDPHEPRGGFAPGQWPGAPHDRLPPESEVRPLGINGTTTFFMDSSDQLITVKFSDWGKKIITQLFATCPNTPYFYWPRFARPTAKGAAPRINGLEVDEAHACLVKAAAERGLFDPADRLRGRGAWLDAGERLVWHSGDALWRIGRGGLEASPPGELDGVFYPRRAPILAPWPEPVTVEETPAHSIFQALQTWTWERPGLDPVIALGGIGVMLLGGALEVRPHLFASGDKAVGKTEMNKLIKGVLGSALVDTGSTTEAGVRQHMGFDALAVAVDEFEASRDNRRAVSLIELARVGYSGARILRGGADHIGVEFRARNAFFCSGINPPPMEPADLSRFAMLDLGRIDAGRVGRPPRVDRDTAGRQILRQLMDAWPRYPKVLELWRAALRAGGLDGRGQDTYGTLFALATLMLGEEAIEEAGLPITDELRLGQMIGAATEVERHEAIENWRECLERLMSSTIDAWKGGEKPTIGGVLERLEQSAQPNLEEARDKLAAAGLGLRIKGDPCRGFALAVPRKGPALDRIFADTKWREGGWFRALKQAPKDVVLRWSQETPPELKGKFTVKINRNPLFCVLVDLTALDKAMEG